MITKEQAKYFIENYGNDDVFYSYSQNRLNNTVEICYFSHLGKLLTPQAIKIFIANFEKEKESYKHLLRTIVVSNTCALIYGQNKLIDTTLENNFHLFKEDIIDKVETN